MAILRAAALMAVVVFCCGFIPVGGCAKGCSGAGRAAARQGDDIARYGTRTSLGVSGAAYADDLARTGTRYGDDMARTGAYGAGAADDLAHTADDLARTADDAHFAGFADDLEQSSLKLSESQHDEVMEAVKTIGEEVAGQLLEGDNAEDEKQIKRAAKDLDKRLQQTLTREQLRKFRAEFGTSKQVIEKLVSEQAAKPGSESAKP
ncbi:MAG TPA: hypothetical protein VIV11_35410 [Kofleriaceae bacterium]